MRIRSSFHRVLPRGVACVPAMAPPGIGTCVVFAFALPPSDDIHAATLASATPAITISPGVPAGLSRDDVSCRPSPMAAAALVTLPLAIADGLLFGRRVKGSRTGPASGV